MCKAHPIGSASLQHFGFEVLLLSVFKLVVSNSSIPLHRTMHKLAILLACSTWTGHGRRVHMNTEHIQGSLAVEPLHESDMGSTSLDDRGARQVAALLRSLVPEAGWQGSGVNKPSFRSVPPAVSRNFNRLGYPVAEVKEIATTEEFQETLDNAGDTLVIIDYSTSWCGPCKIIAPLFADLSELHKDVIFCKVMGDSSDEAMKLLKSQGVRALPAFHFWKNNEQVEMIGGAKLEPLKEAIASYK